MGADIGDRVAERVHIRRFQMPDLSEHGGWIMERLLKAYPLHNERSIATYLRGLIDLNTCLFLYQPHAVALAETVRYFMLTGEPIVVERFVFAKKGHEAEAAEFYVEFHKWAASQQVATMLVEEMTDVPHELVTAKLGRVFTRQQKFAKV